MGGRGPSPFCEGSFLGSCEAAVSAVQLVVGLASVLICVANEVSLRRAFLASLPPLPHRDPAGDSSGDLVSAQRDVDLRQLVDAVLIPVLGYCVLWQAWLPLQRWVMWEWDAGLPPNSLLRMSSWMQ